MEYDMRTFLFSFFLFFLLPGCGGGSGGGAGDTTPDITTVPFNQQAKVNFSSVGNYLVAIRLDIARTLIIDVVDFFTYNTLTYQTGDVDIIIDNPCGGSVQISGSLDEALSSGLLTLGFSNYQDCSSHSTFTFTGSIDLSIYNTETYTGSGNITIPSGFLFSTSDLQITLGSESVTMDGTIEFYHDTSDPEFNWQNTTKNFTLSNSTGSGTFTNYIQKDYTHKGDLYFSKYYYGSSYSGRIYDSDFGYVDVTTVNAVATCNSMSEICPLDPTEDGRIKLSGDYSSALIQLGSGLDTISMDANGDGYYEEVLDCDYDRCY
ncbi:MAG: hypothetical protein AB2540_18685 [Candidatus Thiodiazotropha endolucinida]